MGFGAGGGKGEGKVSPAASASVAPRPVVARDGAGGFFAVSSAAALRPIAANGGKDGGKGGGRASPAASSSAAPRPVVAGSPYGALAGMARPTYVNIHSAARSAMCLLGMNLPDLKFEWHNGGWLK